MKRNNKCPKCESLKVGHLESVPDEAGDYGIRNATIGHNEKAKREWVDGEERQGVLEAYVCTECGYYETYVRRPATVRFAEIKGFRYVNPDAVEQGPFR